MKHRKHKGFSFVELCIVLALMSFVAILAVGLITMSSKGFTASNQMLSVAMQDADFASRINTAIRKSGTSFTIPEQSFIDANLTAGWNYLGIMHGVHIPAEISRTGKEIASTDAFVFIEYVGDTLPETVPKNTEVRHTEDGYFLVTVIGHNYTDTYGSLHAYSLVFHPTDPYNHAAQSLSYEFKSTVSGDNTSTENATIETILQAINAIQVVYQGSETNPATALAFRSDFLPIWSVEQATSQDAKGTVVMIMDVSSSMSSNYVQGTRTKRIDVLKTTAQGFLDTLSANKNINVMLTTFAAFGDNTANFDTRTPCLQLTNIVDGLSNLKNTVNKIKTSQSTNLGDGLRVAYHKLKAAAQTTPELTDYPIFLLVLTDGEVNCATVRTKPQTVTYESTYDWRTRKYKQTPVYHDPVYTEEDFYLGDKKYGDAGFGNTYEAYTGNYSSAGTVLGRQYFQYFGEQINRDFHPKTYLISMYDGMSRDDKEALRAVFDDSEDFNANDLTEFEEVFEQISVNISSVMWAFEGPRI